MSYDLFERAIRHHQRMERIARGIRFFLKWGAFLLFAILCFVVFYIAAMGR